MMGDLEEEKDFVKRVHKEPALAAKRVVGHACQPREGRPARAQGKRRQRGVRPIAGQFNDTAIRCFQPRLGDPLFVHAHAGSRTSAARPPDAKHEVGGALRPTTVFCFGTSLV